VPLTVEPIPPGPRLVVTVPGGSGLEAVLVRADAEPVMKALPPPAEGRTYYVYALAEADRAALTALQGGLAAAPPRAATIWAGPALCGTAGDDQQQERVSVIPVLGGRARPPLIAGETLSGRAARTGAPLPACEGHSG